MQNNNHIHEWRTFNRKDNAIPLWTDCLTCNARKVKETLRGVYSQKMFSLPKDKRDEGKIIIYY